MWECDWDEEVNTNPELRQLVDALNFVDPLQPRDAFFGGRTNAVKLHYVADQDEDIEHNRFDVTLPVGKQDPRVPDRTS